MHLTRYGVLVLGCMGCGNTPTADARSACRIALDRGMGFYVTPLTVAAPPGTAFQVQGNGPPECLPATFYIAPADTAVLSINSMGTVVAKQLGHAYARARATDPTVEGAAEVIVVNVVPNDASR